jgi:hypothetical protein
MGIVFFELVVIQCMEAKPHCVIGEMPFPFMDADVGWDDERRTTKGP